MNQLLYGFVLIFFLNMYACANISNPGFDQLSLMTSVDSLNHYAWENRRKVSLTVKDSVNDSVNRAMEISEELNYHYGLGMALKTMGYLKVRQYEFAKGIADYNRSIKMLNKVNRNVKEDISGIHLFIGNAMKSQGRYEAANNEYYIGLSMAETENKPLLYAQFLTSIAAIEIHRDSLYRAQELFEEAIRIKELYQDSLDRLGPAYYSYASLLYDLGDLNRASTYYDKADDIFKSLHDAIRRAYVLSAKGNISYKQDEDYPRALELYEESLVIKVASGDSLGIARAHYQIGNTLVEMNHLQNAKVNFLAALKIAQALNMLNLESRAYSGLSEANELLGEFEQALTNYQKHIAIKDSLMNKNTRIAIQERKDKHEIEQKERKIENQKRRIWVISITLFLVTIIALGSINFYRQQRKNASVIYSQKEEIHKQKLNSLYKETELKAFNSLIDGQELERKRIAATLHDSMGSLLSAIQLHFNSLSSQLTVDKEKPKQLWSKTLGLLKEATIYNRNLAYQMMPPVLIKFGLPAAVKYLAERVNVPGMKVETSFYGLQERLPEKMELILYRAIDELLNNVIKHAQATEVEIQLTVHEREINVMIHDDGAGFEYDPLNPAYGMGLNTIQSRVEHFNGVFSIDSSLGNGTTAIMNIPLK